jgi:hypothetical protein
MNNCFILFNPDKKIDKKIMCDFIDNNKNDRIILFSFIVNTCKIVEGL